MTGTKLVVNAREAAWAYSFTYKAPFDSMNGVIVFQLSENISDENTHFDL